MKLTLFFSPLLCSLEGLDYYSNLFDKNDVKGKTYVLLDRPTDALSQFPLNTMNLFRMTNKVRDAVRFSPKIREHGDVIIEALGGPNEFIGIHLRVENDWRKHSVWRELAHFGKIKFWFSGKEVLQMLKSFVKNRKETIFVAVGDDGVNELADWYADASLVVRRKSDFLDLKSNNIHHIVQGEE